MRQKQTRLAKHLRSLREAGGLTLRTVEEKTGVSNALISQLESGKVKQPSPIVLYKLAQAYGARYETLMEEAGYPVPESAQLPAEEGSRLRRLGPITEEEEESLAEYLTFLRSRPKRRRQKA